MRIIEVGPRDGLQNEREPIPTEVKVQFIRNLVDAGLKELEVTSFVSPKWVPQLGDAAELWRQLTLPEVRGSEIIDPATVKHPLFSALVPNAKGLERALELGVQRIAVFTAVSDAFTQKNINMTVAESLQVFQGVVAEFKSKTPNGHVRGYVSTAFECPYAGRMEPAETVKVAQQLLDAGVDEISLGDTIGVAVPSEVRVLTKRALEHIAGHKLAYHFHDTRGTAIANVEAAYELGIRAFDSSAAGLGGCPYAPGAGGNLATEDLVYFLERSGEPTGVDLEKLAQASLPVLEHLGRRPVAKAQLAALSTCPK